MGSFSMAPLLLVLHLSLAVFAENVSKVGPVVSPIAVIENGATPSAAKNIPIGYGDSNSVNSAQSSAVVGTIITVYTKTNYQGSYAQFRAPIPNSQCFGFGKGLNQSIGSLVVKWNVKDSNPLHLICGRIILWTKGCKVAPSTGYYFDIPGGFNNANPAKYDYPDTKYSDVLSWTKENFQSITCTAPTSKSPPPPKGTKSPPPKGAKPPPPKGTKSPPPRSVPSPPPSSSSDPYSCLPTHNAARAALNKGIPNLVWNTSVAADAKAWAQQLVSENCAFYHGGHKGQGQNLYWASWSTATCANAVTSWNGEKSYYSYGVFPDYCQSGKVCGHYTQVVWKKTVSVGCAPGVCANGGGVIWVCNYYPPGNYYGQYPY